MCACVCVVCVSEREIPFFLHLAQHCRTPCGQQSVDKRMRDLFDRLISSTVSHTNRIMNRTRGGGEEQDSAMKVRGPLLLSWWLVARLVVLCLSGGEDKPGEGARGLLTFITPPIGQARRGACGCGELFHLCLHYHTHTFTALHITV